MTNRQHRYFSRKVKAARVAQLVDQVRSHPHSQELLTLLQDQVQDDTYRVRRIVVCA
jgi:hypothetical protein